jgi:O-antigen ligase
LQVWYELGAIGALLFLSIGLLTLRAIAKLQASAQPAAIAMFATTSLLIGFSYSMWQTWFMAALGLAITMFTIALRKRSDQLQGDRDSNPPAEGVAASQPVGRKT